MRRYLQSSPLLLILLTAALLAGCGVTDPTADPTVIMPLKVGNTWIERVSEYDSAGILTRDYLDTMAIVSDEMIGSEHWFRSDEPVVRTNRTDGLWVRVDGFNTWLAFHYPAAVADTFQTQQWQETFENGAGGIQFITYMTVTSTDTVITVPAGTYHCYAYELRGASLDGSPLPDSLHFTERYFYAPDVGPVKSETSVGTMGAGVPGTQIRELVEARLK
jgi:hypothetical protein